MCLQHGANLVEGLGTPRHRTIPGVEVQDPVAVSFGCVGWTKEYKESSGAEQVTHPALDRLRVTELQNQVGTLTNQLQTIQNQFRDLRG
jgi:hypothetical protein